MIPPLLPGQHAALLAYANKHGRRWKTRLRQAWMGNPPHDDTGPLRHLRNTHGPNWLQGFRLTPEPPDVLGRLRDPAAAAEACRILIRTSSRDPEEVARDDAEAALEQALRAFALPLDYPETERARRRTSKTAGPGQPSPDL